MIQITIMVVTILCCISCDQAAKTVVKNNLPRHEIISFAGDTLRLQYTENKGAFLGMGAKLPEKARTLIFTAGIGAIVVGFLATLLLVKALPHPTTIALSLIAGGGLSNLIDRMALGGYVVDFLNIGIGNLRTGIFNIADVAIMAGTILLFFKSVKRTKS